MNLLHRLRRLAPGLLGRCLLAWFVLSLGAAVASPIVSPHSMEMVCTATGGMKVIVHADDGSAQELGAAHLDCPMCLPAGAPPPARLAALPPPPAPLEHALRPIEAARLAAATGAPLPARGPPSL